MVNVSDQVAKSTGFKISPSVNKLHLRSFGDMLSPRSSNYDRLEGGLGPSRMAKKFGWKRFAIGAGVLITFVYLFGPRANKSLSWKTKTQQRPMDIPPGKPHSLAYSEAFYG
jgi:guanosine-diphosphatase